MTREPIDFFLVRHEHLDIHAQLMNWSRWCNAHSNGRYVHPMFRHYRNDYFEAAPIPQECDTLSAVALQKAFIHLPEKARWVLNWAYCKPFIPVMKVRRALGMTTPDLLAALHGARTMLKNTI
jgi:hypothetical protein